MNEEQQPTAGPMPVSTEGSGPDPDEKGPAKEQVEGSKNSSDDNDDAASTAPLYIGGETARAYFYAGEGEDRRVVRGSLAVDTETGAIGFEPYE